ncbi:hypothetical protein D3P07_05080 [Paenibacillus sp. 1011MAR3C5]|uniref:hypothetical protein n=1 Tax=Paenibacillus sp. 1011MAR3C5 TaxID=1675787 RepID=UPI000E6B8334|nr:hypothetical protein [Paenibacillus sp. 1011MAR3C5]RJE89618.1 hypothetical protein D3P07_05080 [Paenibacillus sp. 1011MAR3C5]
MNEKELIARMSRLGPTKLQKKRMLSRILGQKARRKPPLRRSVKIAIPAIGCAVLSLALFFPVFFKADPAIPSLTALQQVQPSPFTVTPRHMPLSVSLGPLKMMNYNGHRYTFLNDGAPYDLADRMPGVEEKLGLLQYDLKSDMENGGKDGYAGLDYATTYLLGGSIYRLPGYDPAFRLAVEHEGRYYIAQLSGRTDNSIIPAVEYAEAAELARLTQEVDIMNHIGSVQLHTLDRKKDVRKWIEMFSQSEAAVNRDREADEQWAKAQSEGKSYLAKLRLKDGTAIDIFVIPELGMASLGDNRYILPEAFREAYADLFHSPT